MKKLSVKKLWGFFKERLGNTFLHPQFLALRFRKREIIQITKYIKGLTLDIGSGSQWYKEIISPYIKNYIALDYPVTSKLYEETYGKKPHIYGDVRKLGIKNKVADSVLFLDVIEHLDDYKNAFKEIKRILKKGGVLCFSVPFLYPLHDIPYDYRRWTKYGIESLLEEYDFEMLNCSERGGFWTTWGTHFNVHNMHTIQKIISYKNPLKWVPVLILLPMFLILSILINIICWIFEKIEREKRFTLGYMVVARKK